MSTALESTGRHRASGWRRSWAWARRRRSGRSARRGVAEPSHPFLGLRGSCRAGSLRADAGDDGRHRIRQHAGVRALADDAGDAAPLLVHRAPDRCADRARGSQVRRAHPEVGGRGRRPRLSTADGAPPFLAGVRPDEASVQPFVSADRRVVDGGLPRRRSTPPGPGGARHGGPAHYEPAPDRRAGSDRWDRTSRGPPRRAQRSAHLVGTAPELGSPFDGRPLTSPSRFGGPEIGSTFTRENVLGFGVYNTALVALAYGPAASSMQALSLALRDRICPREQVAANAPDCARWLKEREEVGKTLQTDLDIAKTLGRLAPVLAPVFSAILGLAGLAR